jgi:meso-butanediol dehydrogenase / (S,S)-butanediol dehydrogenase / diacetyl reductase
MSKLSGRVALITGGNSGIGRATALLFAAEEARVVITGRDAAKGAAVVAEIAAAGGDAHFIAYDVRDPAQCDQSVRETADRFGRLDVLFNNAGIVPFGTVPDTSPDLWLDTFATNVHGVFYMSRAALPIMIAQGKGVIVNNASDWGIVGGQRAAAYSASKGAVIQLTRSMALDHGRQGVRVNALCPGDTYVERWRDRWTGDPAAFDTDLARIGELFALGRVGEADEIARAALFLASDDSSYMTGQTLIIDGGNTAGGASVRF